MNEYFISYSSETRTSVTSRRRIADIFVLHADSEYVAKSVHVWVGRIPFLIAGLNFMTRFGQLMLLWFASFTLIVFCHIIVETNLFSLKIVTHVIAASY